MEPDQFKFMIEPLGASTESAIGVIGLNHYGNLGYQLDPSAWGNGFATEALRGYLPALFTNFPKLEEVKSLVIEGNSASRRVLEKCGFVVDNQLPPVTRKNLENDESDTHSEDRREKIYELRTMLHQIGLQSSVNSPPARGKGDNVVYTYNRPKE